MPELSDGLVSRAANPAFGNGEILNQLLLEHQLSQQRPTAEAAGPNPLDLLGECGHAALYSGLQSPAKGLAQIFDDRLAQQIDFLPAPQEAPFLSARWHAQQVGSAIGMTMPFMCTRSAMKSGGLSIGDKIQTKWLRDGYMGALPKRLLIADAAATGFVCDFLTHPINPSEGNQFVARTKHGVAGAVTMGGLTATHIGLSKIGGSQVEKLVGLKKTAHDVTTGALSGIPAGLATADVNAGLFHGRFATNEERAKSAYTMAFAGGTLSGLHKLEGQTNIIVKRDAGRYGDREVKVVGDLASNLRDSVPFNWESPKDNFRMGTEFTKVELDIAGEKQPYYVLSTTGGKSYNYIEHKLENAPGEFYLLGKGKDGPILVRDFEVTLGDTIPTPMAKPAAKAGSKSSAMVSEGAKNSEAKSLKATSPEAKLPDGITVGRVAEGTIKISAEHGEGQPRKVIPIPESAATGFDLGSHFNRLLLEMRGKNVEYYRARTDSREYGIKADEFYILSGDGPQGQKLVRDPEVFIQPLNGKEGMPTRPLSDHLHFPPGAPGRFWTARNKEFFDQSRQLAPLSPKEKQSSEPAKDTFEPYADTFEPPREYDPNRYSENDGMAAMLRDLQHNEPSNVFKDPVPDKPYGTKVVGTTSDGTNIRHKPGWEKNFSEESHSITTAEAQQLGSSNSAYHAVEVNIGGKNVKLFQSKTDHQFYRLTQSGDNGPTMHREFSIFQEPLIELFGTPELKGGWYLNRWSKPVDPVPASGKPGIEIGEINGSKILRDPDLGKGLQPEVINGIANNPTKIADSPFEKVVVQQDGAPVEYFRLKLEPNRFYRWDPTTYRLIRDHSIYVKPN